MGTTGGTNALRSSLGDAHSIGATDPGTPGDVFHGEPAAFAQQQHQLNAYAVGVSALGDHAGMNGVSGAVLQGQEAVKKALDLYSEQQAAMKQRNRSHTYAVRQPLVPGADSPGFQGIDQSPKRELRGHAATFSRPSYNNQQGWGSGSVAAPYEIVNGGLGLKQRAQSNGNVAGHHVGGGTGNLNQEAHKHNYARYGSPPAFFIPAAPEAAGNKGAQLQLWRAANNGVLNGGNNRHRDESSALVHEPLPPIPDFIQQPYAAQKRSVVVFQPASKEVRDQRSQVLNSIVPESGKPDEAVLLHPDNFPFLEPAALEPNGQEHGVIHITNVSRPAPIATFPILTWDSPTGSLRHQPRRGHRLCGPQLADPERHGGAGPYHHGPCQQQDQRCLCRTRVAACCHQCGGAHGEQPRQGTSSPPGQPPC